MRDEILAKLSRKFRIYECLINQSWEETGLANILLARERPDGNILFAAYLVDIFCLGLKDTFWNPKVSKKIYEELKSSIYEEKPLECDISLAHQIIYGAIEYASKIGFKPGPNDNVEEILNRLRKNVGEGNFDYLIRKW